MSDDRNERAAQCMRRVVLGEIFLFFFLFLSFFFFFNALGSLFSYFLFPSVSFEFSRNWRCIGIHMYTMSRDSNSRHSQRGKEGKEEVEQRIKKSLPPSELHMDESRSLTVRRRGAVPSSY